MTPIERVQEFLDDNNYHHFTATEATYVDNEHNLEPTISYSLAELVFLEAFDYFNVHDHFILNLNMEIESCRWQNTIQERLVKYAEADS